MRIYPGMYGINIEQAPVVEDTIKHQLNKDFNDLIETLHKEIKEMKEYERDIAAMDNEGGCQIWYQVLPRNIVLPSRFKQNLYCTYDRQRHSLQPPKINRIEG